MLVLDGMRPAVIGAIGGVAGALEASRLIQSMLFGVSPSDPATYLLAVAAAVIVSFVASALPAIRAVRADVVRALQH